MRRALGNGRVHGGLALATILLIVTATRATAAPRSVFDGVTPPPARRATDGAAPSATSPSAPATAPSAPVPPAADVLTAIPTPLARAAQPPRADVTAARQRLKAAFAEDVKDTSTAGRRALALKLARLARRRMDVPAEEFVLLGAAVQAAREAQDLRLCFALADEMALAFDVDAMGLKVEVVLGAQAPAAAAGMSPNEVAAANFYDYWIVTDLADRLSDAEDFAGAARLVGLLQTLAATDPKTRHDQQLFVRDLSRARTAFATVAKARQTLRAHPEDPAARLAVGCYLCFTQEDWDAGLPLLAGGSDKALRAVAASDLKDHDDDAHAFEQAGLWWDLALKETNPAFRHMERQRAAFGYIIAKEHALDATQTALADQRIAEYEQADEPVVRNRQVDLGPAETFHVRGTGLWAATTFDLKAGSVYRIIAHGRWTDARGVACGPDGTCPDEALSYLGPPPSLPAADRKARYFLGQPRDGLVARVSVRGSHPRNATFFAGSEVTFVAPESGPLQLRMNDGDASGRDGGGQRGGGVDVQVVEISPRWFDTRGEMTVRAVLDGPYRLVMADKGLNWTRLDGNPDRAPLPETPAFPSLINGYLWMPRWHGPSDTTMLTLFGGLPADGVRVRRNGISGARVTIDRPAGGDAAWVQFRPDADGPTEVSCVLAVTADDTALARGNGGRELLRPTTQSVPGSGDRPPALLTIVDDAKQRAAEVETRLHVKLAQFQTAHFLIFTDWDPREYDFLRTNLEAAFRAVDRQFKSSRTDDVFIGVLPIFMFARQDEFRRYAQELDGMTDASPGLLGYFRGSTATGFGYMAMWKPRAADGAAAEGTRQAERDWARTLTHEFTHAFIARYRSTRPIPSWLNEGVAEVVANKELPPEYSVYALARAEVGIKGDTLARLLRDGKRKPTGEQYPVVQSAVETLLAIKPEAFLPFFNDIKDGLGAEQSLRDNYGIDFRTFEQLWKRHIAEVP